MATNTADQATAIPYDHTGAQTFALGDLALLDLPLSVSPEGQLRHIGRSLPRHLGAASGELRIFPWRRDAGEPGFYIEGDIEQGSRLLVATPLNLGQLETENSWLRRYTLRLTPQLQRELNDTPTLLNGLPVYLAESLDADRLESVDIQHSTRALSLWGIVMKTNYAIDAVSAQIEAVELGAWLRNYRLPASSAALAREHLERLRASANDWYAEFYYQRRIYQLSQHGTPPPLRNVLGGSDQGVMGTRYLDAVVRSFERWLADQPGDATEQMEKLVRSSLRNWDSELCLFLLRRGFAIRALDGQARQPSHLAVLARLFPNREPLLRPGQEQLTAIGQLRCFRPLAGEPQVEFSVGDLWAERERSIIVRGPAGSGKTFFQNAVLVYFGTAVAAARPMIAGYPQLHPIVLSSGQLIDMLGALERGDDDALSGQIRQLLVEHWAELLRATEAAGGEPQQMLHQVPQCHYRLFYDQPNGVEASAAAISHARLHRLCARLPMLRVSTELAACDSRVAGFFCVDDGLAPPLSSIDDSLIDLAIALGAGWQRAALLARFQPYLPAAPVGGLPIELHPLMYFFDAHQSAEGLAEWQRFVASPLYVTLVESVPTPAELFALWYDLCRVHCQEGKALRPFTCDGLEYAAHEQYVRKRIGSWGAR